MLSLTWNKDERPADSALSQPSPSLVSSRHISQTNGQHPKGPLLPHYPPQVCFPPSTLIFITALSGMTSFANSIACVFLHSLWILKLFTLLPLIILSLFFCHHHTLLITLPLMKLLLTTLLSSTSQLSIPGLKLVFHSVRSVLSLQLSDLWSQEVFL